MDSATSHTFWLSIPTLAGYHTPRSCALTSGLGYALSPLTILTPLCSL